MLVILFINKIFCCYYCKNNYPKILDLDVCIKSLNNFNIIL